MPSRKKGKGKGTRSKGTRSKGARSKGARSKSKYVSRTTATNHIDLNRMHRDLLFTIKSFLPNPDKNNFSMLTKHIHAELAGTNSYITLPKYQSYLYYTDSESQEYIHSLISANGVIHLQFYPKWGTDEEEYKEILGRFDTYIDSELISCARILKETKRKYHITIKNQIYLYDVSIFGELGNYLLNLNLSGCTSITDASALGAIHTLNLSHCSIIDASALAQVHTLNLTYCPITDASALINVYALNLWHGPLENINVFGEGKVHTLKLSSARIIDVSQLGKVHTLDLSYCANLQDVSALGGVHTLILIGCHSITDVSALGGVHALNLRGCGRLSDVRALGGVHTLDLSYCNQVRDVSALGGVHTLNLSYLYHPINISMLGNVTNLILTRTQYYYENEINEIN